ncbi:MAG TPA: hypothetical protein VFO56_02900, partial [Gaiellaceae bacterium]|nr:hypothetical protein [Gaiellaceae bacterium]
MSRFQYMPHDGNWAGVPMMPAREASSSTSTRRLRLGLRPVVTDADVDGEGRVERIRAHHLL